MKEFNAETVQVQTAAALERVSQAGAVRKHALYVGLDVHKETIAVAMASPGRDEPTYRNEIANKPKAVAKLIGRLSRETEGAVMLFCYEAGPCGYELYRQILGLGHDCQVVAPSLIPKKAGERIKTDRRDALKLAGYLRSGDLTAVWVPDREQEAMRDLTRARNDMKGQERKARQQLGAFVLRHGHSWPAGKSRWTKGHYNWLESLRFEHEWQQIVLQEYINAAKAATARVAEMTGQMMAVLPNWTLAPVVDSLVAELGDISRFDSPRQLMAYLGLVPSEHTSGGRRRQGAITRTGNGHARRTLVESAWSYRFPARQTAHLKRKAANASEEAREIAWRAQKRLCGRYGALTRAGKNTKVACVAVARELIGFIWDIVRHEMPKLEVRSARRQAA